MRKRTHALLALAAAIVAALATTASPAAAGGADGVSYCDDGSLFSSLSSFGTVAARGDDQAREPTINEQYESMPASAKGKGKPATIPVWFHVVSPDGVIGNVTREQIDEQMNVLNLSFAGFYGGANTGFKFKLAGITRSVNADWFDAGPGSPAEREMKKALSRDAPQALNYYSTTASLYLGWAYLPGLTPSRMYLDGVVVDWESMPGTSTRYANRYDLGFTATHEVGHWINLEHTFWGGCNANGDYVDDTPAMKVPTSGCPADGTKDTCTNDPGFDPIHNFMDYSYDACYFEFTPGQAERMQDAYAYFRS